jgi:hypothetical protein
MAGEIQNLGAAGVLLSLGGRFDAEHGMAVAYVRRSGAPSSNYQTSNVIQLNN